MNALELADTLDATGYNFKAVSAMLRQLYAENEAYKECQDDKNRLVRELDVALNGAEGAAKQASLCDIVGQVKSSHWVLVKRHQRFEPLAWMFEYGTDRGDAVNGISWYPNVHFKKPDLNGFIRNIEPLYGHPVKILNYDQLSDLAFEFADEDGELDLMGFYLAILRKSGDK